MAKISKSFARPNSKYMMAAQWVIAVNLVQVCIGLTITVRGHAQVASPVNEVAIERLRADDDNTRARVTAIESANIPSRVAVLENRTGEIELGIAEIKRIAYGALVTIIISVVAQFIQIKGQRRNIRDRYDSE